VSADNPHPVVARFGAGLTALLDRALAAHDNQAAGIGKVGLERFDGEGVQGPGLHQAVTGLGVDKKGVSFNPSNPCAGWSRLGWLPLIWLG
jgi:hypothetical protein